MMNLLISLCKLLCVEQAAYIYHPDGFLMRELKLKHFIRPKKKPLGQHSFCEPSLAVISLLGLRKHIKFSCCVFLKQDTKGNIQREEYCLNI